MSTTQTRTTQTRKNKSPAWRAAEAAFAAAFTGKAADFKREAAPAGDASPAPRREGKRPILSLAKTCLN